MKRLPPYPNLIWTTRTKIKLRGNTPRAMHWTCPELPQTALISTQEPPCTHQHNNKKEEEEEEKTR
jgi:hypothetical protein